METTPLHTLHIATVEFWLRRLRKWVDSITRDPPYWHRQIDLLASLEERDINDEVAIVSLISLLCLTAQKQIESGRELLLMLPRDPIDRPPLPLLSDYVSAVHTALVKRGSLAAEILMQTYQNLPESAPCRLWVLRVLADIADPQHEHFFQNLNPEDLTRALQAKYQLAIEGIQSLLELSHPQNNELKSQAENYIAMLRRQYQDRARRN